MKEKIRECINLSGDIGYHLLNKRFKKAEELSLLLTNNIKNLSTQASPSLKRKGKVITNYVENLLSMGDSEKQGEEDKEE